MKTKHFKYENSPRKIILIREWKSVEMFVYLLYNNTSLAQRYFFINHFIIAALQGGVLPVVLLRSKEAQVALIVASAYLHCKVWGFSSSSTQHSRDSLLGLGQVSFLTNQAQLYYGY